MKQTTYIIAEIGINHNGLIENCFRMIDAAVDAGCDAVKFQFFKAKKMYPKSAGMLDWKDADKKYSYDIYSAVESFELPEAWIDDLIKYSYEKNIDFLSSVFDIDGCDLLIKKGMKTIKLPSYVITNLPLIEYCAKSGLPVILSTGGATLGETEEAVNTVLRYHNNLTILHCSIQYPTALKDCNIGVIETLRYAFPQINVGYSDHTIEISEAPVQAVYLGATVIEKHITLDKKMQGPDHFFAVEPNELNVMVKDIRQAEVDMDNGNCLLDRMLYGNTAKICHEHEKYLRDFAFMTLFANKDIKTGEVITPEDISILRPGKKNRGLDPKYLRLFADYHVVAKKNIAFEDPVNWDSII